MSWEGLNRRSFPRANFPCLIKLSKEDSSEEKILTHTENFSSHGMCVIIKQPLDLFSFVDMELDFLDGNETIHVKGKIVWTIRRKATEEVKPCFYDTGIEMSGLNKEDQARIEAIITRILAAGKATDIA